MRTRGQGAVIWEQGANEVPGTLNHTSSEGPGTQITLNSNPKLSQLGLQSLRPKLETYAMFRSIGVCGTYLDHGHLNKAPCVDPRNPSHRT